MDGSPSRLQSSARADHFHRAGSRNTLPVRIFRPEFPGGLVARLCHHARRIQTRILADSEQQEERCIFHIIYIHVVILNNLNPYV